jgi:hypothetical protein
MKTQLVSPSQTKCHVALGVCAALLPLCAAGENVVLNASAIAPQGAPRFVQRAFEDLQKQLEAAGAAKSTGTSFRATVDPKLEKLGEDGFDLRVLPEGLAVTASTWYGVQYGVLESILRIARSPDGHSLPAGLHLHERPDYNLRGMYAHTAWVYNYPFALRRWNLQDWKHYVDLLAYMKVNLLQIWNLVSILPQPLSQADQNYLSMFDDVVRYAKEERGFRQVWLGDAANDVALPSNVPIADRQFYVVHALRNPANASQMGDIVKSRSALYRIDPDADGFWVIDSDPGGWPKSSSEDFYHILAENRKLIDEYASKRNRAELIYWIWQGWGTQSKSKDLSDILANLQRLPGDHFGLLACFPEDLPVIHSFGMMPRTVWFPYGAIEGEPSSPYTALRFTLIQKSLAIADRSRNLRGVMGNAQTPLVQIPNLWFFESSAWSSSYAQKNQEAVLDDLASALYPQFAHELVRAWTLLSASDSTAARNSAAALADAAQSNRLGSIGPLARYMSPNGRRLIAYLAIQLRTHAAAVDLKAKLQGGADPSTVEHAADEYFEDARRVLEANGFRPAPDKQGRNLLPFFNWYYQNEDWSDLRKLWDRYKQEHKKSALEVKNTLKTARQGECADCPEMIDFLVGEPPKRPPDFKYAN